MRRAALKNYEVRQDVTFHRIRRETQAGFGVRVRAMRESRGWSQNELACRCRMRRDLLGQIERGHTNLRLESLLLIAAGLNTTVAELFMGIA